MSWSVFVSAKADDAVEAVEAVKKIIAGEAHGVLIMAPSLVAFKQAVGMTRK